MDSLQIETILSGDPHTANVFRGVYPCDKLPKTDIVYPSAYVCNTDPHTERGQHWVALYLDADGYGEHFDSYGSSSTDSQMGEEYLRRFLDRRSIDWTYNTKRLQSFHTAVCGQYCLFYLLHRCQGFTLNAIVNTFTDNTLDNDFLVHDFVSQRYHIRLPFHMDGY